MSTTPRAIHLVDVENIFALTHGKPVSCQAGELYRAIASVGDGDLIEVAFGGPDRQFRLFSLVTPADPNVKDSVAGGDGGLLMTGIDGKPQRLFTCIERPTVSQGDLEKATECNNRTSLGEAACNVMAPPPRTEPLALPSAQ